MTGARATSGAGLRGSCAARSAAGFQRRARALATVLALGACTAADRPGAVEIGAPAPAYRATTLSGDTVSLADRRGKVVLLNIWATWCKPCREELPVLQGLHERYAPDGLSLVGVSVDARGDEAEIRSFARRYGVTYEIWRDPDERVSTTFLALGVPATYLIGRDGNLLWKHIGPVKSDDPALVPLIEKALAAGDG